MANFTGFSEAEIAILKADLEAARQIAAAAAALRPETSTLFQEAFGIDPAAPEPERVNQVRSVYAGFATRMATAALVFDPGRGNACDPEFDSFPDRTRPNTILVRRAYFFKSPFDRALTLLHHYVHLQFPLNPGGGHPGGCVPAFARGSMRIAFDDASRNPYCYEYFARFLRLI